MSTEFPKGAILSRIAAELRDLSVQTALIEDALADETGGERNFASGTRRAMQELDRVRQTQDCLAECLEVIADSIPVDRSLSDSILFGGAILPSIAERLRTGARLKDADPQVQDPEIW